MQLIFDQMSRFKKMLVMLTAFMWTSWQMHAQVLWFKDFSPGLDGPSRDASINVRGNIHFLGNIGFPANGFYEMDATGTLVDTFAIPGGQYNSFVPTEDHGFAFYGVPFSFNFGEILLKVDSSLNVVWQVPFSPTINTWPIDIIEGSDGYLYTLAELSTGGFDGDLQIRKFDSGGGLLWTVVTGDSGDDNFCSIALFDNGDLLVISTVSIWGTSFFRMERLDPSGNSLWVNTYFPPQAIAHKSVPATLPDGGFMLFGSTTSASSGYASSVFRFDTTGSFVWERVLTTASMELSFQPMPVKDLKGGFSVAIETWKTFGNMNHSDIAVLHFDTLGNPLSMHRVGHPGNETPISLVQMPDTNYIVVGISTSFNQVGIEQVYAAKVGHGGCDREFYFPPFPQMDTICYPDTLLLDAGPGFMQYLWSTGHTGQYLMVTQPDTFFVQGIDTNGCVYTSWTCYIISPDSVPQLSYTVNGLTVSFESDNIGQWSFGDGTSIFANDPTYTYASPGIYEVCIQYDGAFCETVINCDSIQVGLVSVSTTEDSFEIFPNPTSNHVIIKAGSATSFDYELWDANGILLKKQSTLGSARLDLHECPVGIYTIRVIPQDGCPPLSKRVSLLR